MSNAQLFESVTNKIVTAIEKGQLKSWQSPFKNGGVAKNYFSGHEYSGINFLLLNFFSGKVPLYGTFKQISAAGGKVLKGTKGERIIFASVLNKHNGKTITPPQAESLKKAGEKVESFFIYKEHVVFSLQDTEGIDYKKEIEGEAPVKPIEAAEKIILGYKDMPKITNNPGRAFYRPSEDVINIPLISDMVSPSEYYSVFFHEMIHSTGAKKRLNRSGVAELENSNREDRSLEELIAELGAAMLAALCGIDLIDNNAAYIKSWLKPLKDDSKMIFKAAAAASKAVDYILK